ncbi:short chain dehydrogenase [Nonomuraea sp. SBT364]|uniref:short chain dehydrogenase n=1 Tax=Nonomuraea sp. SBT364 TaxID=1580530 RepID=UPI00066A3100|nr:short chain dehydrogenase [Nonomuraea sp. SBT364]
MKIVVIGATGTIGGAVAGLLATGHEVVPASRRGPVRVDLTDAASIDALFAAVPDVDAVVCCAASGSLSPLDTPSDADYWRGLDGKLVGQVTLARRAAAHLRAGGSVTLTSGRFTAPTPGSTLGHLVNAGLEAFVRAAAPEMPRGIRLNAISPGWVRETCLALGMDGTAGIPAADLARAYADTIEGTAHGHVITP